nr:ThuA domain-containing protein [Jiangella gansuensis]
MSHPAQRVRHAARRLLAAGLAALVSAPLVMSATAAPAAAHPGHGGYSVLVFSKTAGFRHDSIPAGIAAIEQLGAEHDFDVTATEDAAAFTDENLAQYDVVVWLSTTGDVLNGDQQAAFERYIQAGGGYAGIHSASDTEYDWPWYGELVGAYFASHPANQTATVKVEDPAHPSTDHLDPLWTRYDEWYNYRSNPRGDVHVLTSLDESSYSPGGGAMGHDHPITWCQDYDGGRSWYTGLGHTQESYSEPEFLELVLGGLETAAGVTPADCSASVPGSFEKVTLDDTTSNPMELDVADDGRVFYVDRNGLVRLIRQDGSATTVGTLSVYTGQEFGLMGIALDPDFTTNNWMYLTYAPAGGEAVDRVSRFTLNGETLDLASETVIIEYPTNRVQCCHAGGALEFDNDGNLYIATGDNTNPFASDGYAPIDERPDRALWDAQRTSANTDSLSGKVLRITPSDGGGYTVPDGNLFPPGTAQTRPEIFAMGFRNPFRIGLDPATNTLMVADYGPDAGSANPSRGPDGRVEWNIVDEPGFYGWPYCVGNNTPYIDYDFATGQSGAAFDCAAPVNDSPNNTGLTQLPAAVEAEVWYGYSTNPLYPEIGGGGAPMAGGVYRYDPQLVSDRKWPAYWDGKAVFGEWNQGNLYSFQLDEAGTAVTDINALFPDWAFARPHAMQWGPDGALYLIEWGSGFGGDNADSGVYRIDYVQGTRAPVARIAADPLNGPVPLEVTFDGSASIDPEGGPITYAWDFDGDGTTDSTDQEATHTYTEAGDYTVALTVTDADDLADVANVEIVAGNTAPEISVAWPPNGGFFDFGDTIAYDVGVTDAEDGAGECPRVVTQPALGHDDHSHGYEQYFGCTGVFPLPGDAGHIGANIFGTVSVTYTDDGAPGVSPLTSQEVLVLQPKRREAEHFDSTGRLTGSTSGGDPGVQVETTGDDLGGGQNIGWIEPGDWWAWDPMNLTNIDAVTLRAATPSGPSTVEVRTGAPDGPTVATITVEPTGDWQQYDDFTGEVSGDTAGDSGPLYFVNVSGQLNVNWIDFDGKGVTENERPDVEVTATPTSGTAPLDVAFEATATDPEGDLPLTYEWVFGDGGTATGATAAHTYTEAGTYDARVTVTDARGAAATEHVAIDVDADVSEPPVCLAGRSDGFDGDALDRDRWTTVVRENQELTVADGHLVLPATSTDIYGTNNTDTPNIVLQDLPDGPFTATAKLTMQAYRAYQQAGLIIYGDDDNYAKMVLQGRDTAASNPAARIFQFIREENGAPNEVGESNTANLGAGYPDTVWVRYISDGSTLRAAYSADGVTFAEMPQTKSLAGIDNPKIGLVALSGSGQPVTEVRFDSFHITPDDTAPVPEPDDEFDGAALDGCRWTVLRPDEAALRVAGGQLEIDTSDGDIYTGDTDPAPSNFVLQPAPDGDEWTIETVVDGSLFDEQYQQGGLIVYENGDTYVKLDLVTDNQAGQPVTRRIELRSEVDAVIQNPQPQVTELTQGAWHLRLTRSGETYAGSYSADGETWTPLAEPVTNAALSEGDVRVGLFALGAAQGASKTARFDHFRVDSGAPACEPTVSEEGYTSLFDGTAASLDGWGMAGPGGFALTEDCALLSEGGMGLYWYQADSFEDYSLKLDWMMPGDDNSGVFVGFPDPGEDPWVAVEQGHEIQIDATDAADRTTGAVYAFQSADIAARDAALNPPGEWNEFEIVVQGNRIRVYLNGALINDYTDTDPNRMNQPSFVGIQNHGNGDDVYFRDIRIAELVDETAPTVELTLDPAEPTGQNGWWTGPVSVSAVGTDDGGEVTLESRLDGGDWEPYTGAVVVDADGEHVVEVRGTDPAGNVSEPVAATVRKDATAPVTTATTSGSAPVSVTLAATDEHAGMTATDWSLDDGDWTPYDGPVEVSGDGEHELRYRSTDAAGNVEDVKAVTVTVDGSAPVLVVSGIAHGQLYGDSQDLTVTWTATDNGPVTVTAELDGEPISSGTVLALHAVPLGLHELQVTATDAAGNSTTQRITFFVTTSFADMELLITRFEDDGLLDKRLAKDLQKALGTAHRQDAMGRDERAVRALESFKDIVTDRVADVGVRATLLRDADAMILRLGGTPSGSAG